MKFNDSDNILDWAKNSVSMVVKMKSFNGYEYESFKADKEITRAEVIKSFYNMFVNVDSK